MSPTTAAKPPLDLQELFPELAAIGDARLRDAVVTIWQEFWQQCEFTELEAVPVSQKIDYPQIRHCQGILKAALAVAAVWESVHNVHFDRDALIAGALLMDVSKLVETRPGCGSKYESTDIGRALPHAFYAAHRALELGVPLPVVHIITAHSPNGGKAPGTPECRLLDWIDQADIGAFGHHIWARKVVHFQP
jgi:hypothetical protein